MSKAFTEISAGLKDAIAHSKGEETEAIEHKPEAIDVKAIREKCLDCSYGSAKEARECPVINCAIYPYRLGCRPSKSTLDTIKEYYDEKP